MAESKKSAGKKIVDVAHPGKTAPSGNSKSVIVTSRPIMKDPMVVESDESTEDTKISVKTAGAVIKPISDSTPKEEESDDKPKLEKEDDKKTIAVLAEEAAVRKESADDDEKESDSPVVEQTDEDEKPADEPADSKEEEPLQDKPQDNKTDPESDEGKTTKSVTEAEDAAAAEQEKRDIEIQKLVDSKKYELPIETVETRRNKRVVILGVLLSIILILAWVDIALDASLIQIDGIKPVTHFFSN